MVSNENKYLYMQNLSKYQKENKFPSASKLFSTSRAEFESPISTLLIIWNQYKMELDVIKILYISKWANVCGKRCLLRTTEIFFTVLSTNLWKVLLVFLSFYKALKMVVKH